MSQLSRYLKAAEAWVNTPARGDDFAIELDDGTLLETYILDQTDNRIVLEANSAMIEILEHWNLLSEFAGENPDDLVDNDPGVEIDHDARAQQEIAQGELDAIERGKRDFQQSLQPGGYIPPGGDRGRPMASTKPPQPVKEAEYQGRKVPLGKPMRGDVKKFKVYVRDPSTGNVKKVNFGHGGTSAKRLGQKTMKIKKSNPARRRSFRARHHCANPGPRTKARYWSCRAW